MSTYLDQSLILGKDLWKDLRSDMAKVIGKAVANKTKSTVLNSVNLVLCASIRGRVGPTRTESGIRNCVEEVLGEHSFYPF
jgi:hypothetical protein